MDVQVTTVYETICGKQLKCGTLFNSVILAKGCREKRFPRKVTPDNILSLDNYCCCGHQKHAALAKES